MADEKKESKLRLSEEQQRQYLMALQEVGADRDCQRCGADFETSFGIASGRTAVDLHLSTEPIESYEQNYFEAIIAVCINCGSMNLHATGILDRRASGEVEESDG
ncbi:hypothetical protein MUN76_15290 [Leucobacter rhizosphaerae]|uniref:HNH endonuclease n=1 Tax=Leucobacter rhizosphaerae TaxID=2932245 RepID=A0ABY4FVR3_9MICO|nr:hypothetical protein [Leucobacter rhizosphaerae]UOQ60373.1 hypothetical protein MUN76_15290 [Leucobacter rhizosphaerae]